MYDQEDPTTSRREYTGRGRAKRGAARAQRAALATLRACADRQRSLQVLRKTSCRKSNLIW